MSGSPWTTRRVLNWLKNDTDNDPLEFSAPPFDPASKNPWVDWQNSSDHAIIIARGVLATIIDATTADNLIKIDCNSGSEVCVSIFKPKDRANYQESNWSRLQRYPQRCDLISEIALQIVLTASKVFNKVSIKRCKQECALDASGDSPVRLYFEQASFLALKPSDEGKEGGLKYLDDLWGQGTTAFGWRSSSIPVKNTKYANDVEGELTSLCHFPAFFFGHHTPLVLMLNVDSEATSVEQLAINYPDDDPSLRFLYTKGIKPYIEKYQSLKTEGDLPLLLVWLGLALGPECMGFSPEVSAKDNFLAAFWGVRVSNAENGQMAEFATKVRECIDRIRYRMLLAFAYELQNELENEKRRTEAIADNHNKIVAPLNNLLRSLLEVQDKARYIKQVVDPAGALFACRREISDLFNDIPGKTIPNLPDVPYSHQPDGWNSTQIDWVTAKVASLLCGQSQVWSASDSNEARIEALNKMTESLDSKEKVAQPGEKVKAMLAHQRTRVWLDSGDFENILEAKQRLIGGTNLVARLKRIKDRFHGIYKDGAPASVIDFSAFMPMVSFNNEEYQKQLIPKHRFPLRSVGYLIEVLAALIFHRWIELFSSGVSEAEVRFSSVNAEKFCFQFINFLDNDSDRVSSLFLKLSVAMSAPDDGRSDYGNMTALLMLWNDISAREAPILKLSRDRMSISFQWGEDLQVIISPNGIDITGNSFSLEAE